MVRKSKLLTNEEISELIIDSLYDKNLINEEIYEKCSKVHISTLPFDNRTNDPDKLNIRRDAINDTIKEVNQTLENSTKTRDTIEENITSLEKQQNNISEQNQTDLDIMERNSQILTNMTGDAQDTMDNITTTLSNSRMGRNISDLVDLLDDGEFEDEEERMKKLEERGSEIQNQINELTENIHNYLSGTDAFVDGKLFENLTNDIEEFANDYMESRIESRTPTEGEPAPIEKLINDLKDSVDLQEIYEEHYEARSRYSYNSTQQDNLTTALKEEGEKLSKVTKEIVKSNRILVDLQAELKKISDKIG